MPFQKLIQPKPAVRACFKNEATHELQSVPVSFWGHNPGEDPVPLVMNELDSKLEDARNYKNFVRLQYNSRAVKQHRC